MMEKATRFPRICCLTEEFFPVMAGVEVHIMTLAGTLREQGIDVCVATRRLTGRLPVHEVVAGIPVYRVPPTGDGPLKKWLMIIPLMVWLIRRRRGYDIIYVPSFRTLGWPAVAASRLLGKRCVLLEAVHGEMSGEIFDHGLRRLRLSRSSLAIRMALRMRNRFIRSADVFVSNSSEVAAEYRNQGVKPGKIRHIPHGVDTDRFRPATPEEKIRLRGQLGLIRNGAVVTYVGRLVTYKGLPQLLRVWAKVAPRHPGACLVLVGSGLRGTAYDCQDQLKDFVRAQGLDRAVFFTGQVKNVAEYLQASDIFVFPSRRDTFAIALVEAMSCGLPAVIMPRGGPKEIVTDGLDGIWASSAEDFQKALENLMQNPSLAGALGQAARRTVVERYDRRKEVQAYADLFTSLATNKFDTTDTQGGEEFSLT